MELQFSSLISETCPGWTRPCSELSAPTCRILACNGLLDASSQVSHPPTPPLCPQLASASLLLPVLSPATPHSCLESWIPLQIQPPPPNPEAPAMIRPVPSLGSHTAIRDLSNCTLSLLSIYCSSRKPEAKRGGRTQAPHDLTLLTSALLLILLQWHCLLSLPQKWQDSPSLPVPSAWITQLSILPELTPCILHVSTQMSSPLRSLPRFLPFSPHTVRRDTTSISVTSVSPVPRAGPGIMKTCQLNG